MYFLKDSRPIERFKKMALESEKYIQGKSVDEIEKLVRTSQHFNYDCDSSGARSSTVLLYTGPTSSVLCSIRAFLGTSRKSNRF